MVCRTNKQNHLLPDCCFSQNLEVINYGKCMYDLCMEILFVFFCNNNPCQTAFRHKTFIHTYSVFIQVCYFSTTSGLNMDMYVIRHI